LFLRERPGTPNVYTTSGTAAVTSATGWCAGDHEFAGNWGPQMPLQGESRRWRAKFGAAELLNDLISAAEQAVYHR
jgi:hypothetical protein